MTLLCIHYSLSKDMNGREDVFRAAAVRALCAITDSTTLQGIERYMKQAIVDKVCIYLNKSYKIFV